MLRSNVDKYYIVSISLIVLGILGTYLVPKASDEDPNRMELSSFPRRIGNWTGYDRPFSEAIVRQLGATEYLMRQYTSENGKTLWVYIGYFKDQRASLRGHVPEVCYPAQGWIVEDFRSYPMRFGRETINVRRLIVKKDNYREEVLYWWQSGEKVIASKLLFQLKLLLQAIITGSSDGVIVILSAPASEANCLGDFFKEILPILPNYITG